MQSFISARALTRLIEAPGLTTMFIMVPNLVPNTGLLQGTCTEKYNHIPNYNLKPGQ